MNLITKFINELKNKAKNRKLFIKINKIKNISLNWIEFYPWRAIFTLFLFFCAIKIIITQIYVDPTCTADGYAYMKMARSFWHQNVFEIDGIISNKYPPLYPIVISPSYIFKDIIDVFRTVLIINVFISSSIIFPTFLFAKEILSDKRAFFASIVVSISASNIAMIFRPISENLFYTLILITFFLIYISVKKDKKYIYALIGIFTGLSFLTKYTAVILIPSVFIFYILIYKLYYKNNKITILIKSLKNVIIIYFFAFIILLPWIIRNILIFGFSVKGIIGLGYSVELSYRINDFSTISYGITQNSHSFFNLLSNFFVQIVLNHGFLVLSSGIFLFIFTILSISKKFKNNNKQVFIAGILILIISELFIFLTSFHNIRNTWNMMGRYIEPVIPVFIIIGLSYYFSLYKLNKRDFFIIFFSSLPMFLLINMKGHLGSYLSIAFFGVILDINDYIKIFGSYNFPEIFIRIMLVLYIFIILILFYILIEKKRKKLILVLILIILITSTIFGTASYIYANKLSQSTEIYQLGKLLNNNVLNEDIIFIFDNDSFYQEKIWYAVTRTQAIIGSWINAKIINKGINSTYNLSKSAMFISTKIYDRTIFYTCNISDPLGEYLSFKSDEEIKIYIYYIKIEKKEAFVG